MTTQALYNKWRGQTFEDILGQEHITTTLRNQVRMGRIGHAYLFVGLRGTGKTSTARILAKAVNCIGQTGNPPCNHCPICISLTEGRSTDLVEIDAASNRGIDEIRNLREGVAFLPSECRYKVYVIDEVHMLTKEAFNALLKTLEEPPPRVIFILCTTEVQSLPPTVLSRCQRFDFRRGSLETITKKLQMICQQENIHIAPDALDYIARRATGSYRDAESLLDQLAAFGDQEITLAQIKAIIGAAPAQQILSLVNAILGHDLSAGLRVINQMIDQGADPREIATAVIDQLRAITFLVAGNEDDLSLAQEEIQELRESIHRSPFALRTAVSGIRLFNEAVSGIKGAARPSIPLELAFIQTCLEEAEPRAREQPPAPAVASVQQSRPARTSPSPAEEKRAVPNKESTLQAETSPQPVVAAPAREAATPVPAGSGGGEGELTLELVEQKWSQILAQVRELNPQVRALLNSTAPLAVHQNTLRLGCPAVFHRDKLMEAGKRGIVEQVLAEVLGKPVLLQCELGQAEKPVAKKEVVSDASGSDPREAAKQRLRNHPAVQELLKRGGKVTEIRLNDDQEEREHKDGK